MTRESNWWTRLDAVFQGALELPPAERPAYLDRACRADPDLRAEVEEMLAAEGLSDALDLERLVPPDDPFTPETDPIIGMRLGAWRVLRAIGQGGMGTVYLAERADGQYEQRVALKLVRGSAQQPGAASRFRSETHILARLSHPNIARLLDAGFTPEGSPYLVMEYVEGSPITTYCDAQHLAVDERLRLFRMAARATQHAHQSLVVHRDLKPLNIFVSGEGEVKLLDFGIAKLLRPDHPLGGQTTEMRALTPAYAAPEQLRGEPVTTATDVFVLGAVLYELLTGQRPAEGGFMGGPTGEQRSLPQAPSQSIRRRLAAKDADSRAGSAAIANARGTTPARLARRLEGDIDRIVLKALQPEPHRRYRSAEHLADDIDRLLDGRPVLAQPDRLLYRARRFVGRHRVGVFMTATLFAVALTFAVVAVWQARAVAVERDRARLEANRSARVTVLLAELFKLADPGASTGQSITARQLLDAGRSRIASELAGDPAMQAALFNVVGRLYSNLSLHDTAIEIFQQALALERKERPQGSLTQAETMHWLGELHVRKNDYVSAERFFRDALLLRQALGAPADDVAATLEALGRALSFSGRHGEAEVPLQQAVEIRRRQQPTSPAALMSALNELALTLHRKGDLEVAERLFREAVEVGRRAPASSPERVASLLNLARLVHRFDRNPNRAEPMYRESLALARAIYPDDHEDVANCLGELARAVRDQRKLPEAEALAREARAMFTRLFGVRHRETMIASQTLASIRLAQGDIREAETLSREALATARELFKDGHPMTLAAERSLAALLDDQKRFKESLELRQAELASATKALGAEDVYVALALTGLGQHGLASGNLPLADSSFRRALDVRERLHGSGDWRTAEARGMVGAVRLRAGRFAEAEPDLLSAYEALQTLRGPTAPETSAVRVRLVELYERWNRHAEAQRYRTSAR